MWTQGFYFVIILYMGNEIENLQILLKEDPSNFQARRELSILLAENGFNEEALSNLRYLEKYFPEDAELQYNLGILYEKTKNSQEARVAYEKAIEISPQDDFYYNLGEVLVELKEWDLAMDAFKKVLEADPNDGNCYFNLGLCYLNKDERSFASDNFQKAISLNPQDIFAHFYLGNLYQEDGLTNFAVDCYNKVLELSPDYSWAYYNLASIAFKNGNLDDAKEYLLKTIHYNDTDIEAYELLTKICLQQDNVEEIITILASRLKKEENGNLYYMLARVYKHIELESEYYSCLKKALANAYTLNYDRDVIKQELEYIEYKLKPEATEEDFDYDEYESTEEEISDVEENFEEAEEDEIINEYDEENDIIEGIEEDEEI